MLAEATGLALQLGGRCPAKLSFHRLPMCGCIRKAPKECAGATRQPVGMWVPAPSTQHREGQRCEDVANVRKSQVSTRPQQGAGAAGGWAQRPESDRELACSLGFFYGWGAALQIFKQTSLLERLPKASRRALPVWTKAEATRSWYRRRGRTRTCERGGDRMWRCDGEEKEGCGDAAQALGFGKGTGGSFQERLALGIPAGGAIWGVDGMGSYLKVLSWGNAP